MKYFSDNSYFTANVNLFYPATVIVNIIGFGLNNKTFFDTDGNTWNKSELSNLIHYNN